MEEDNPYDDAAEDDYDESASQTPLRGTASGGNPFAGDHAPQVEGPANATITINAPDGSVREYELTEKVRKGFEDGVHSKFERIYTDYYDLWWEGTELVIEYCGYVRDSDIRPTEADQQGQQGPQSPQGQQGQQGQPEPGLPRDPRPPWTGRMGIPQVFVDVSEVNKNETEHLDNGLLPITNRTRIDIQEKADARPLHIEDLFIEPWNKDEPQDPINSEHSDGEVEFEVDDFRDEVGNSDKTVQKGSRGDWWNR